MSERDERIETLAKVIGGHSRFGCGCCSWGECAVCDSGEYEVHDCAYDMDREVAIAQALLDSPAMRDLLAEERAKALREAADDVSLVLANEVGGHTSTYSVRNWLRKRAIEEAGR